MATWASRLDPAYRPQGVRKRMCKASNSEFSGFGAARSSDNSRSISETSKVKQKDHTKKKRKKNHGFTTGFQLQAATPSIRFRRSCRSQNPCCKKTKNRKVWRKVTCDDTFNEISFVQISCLSFPSALLRKMGRLRSF